MSKSAQTPAEIWAARQTERGRLIDGIQIAREIEAEIASEAGRLKSAGTTPHLATVQIGQEPATDLYIRNQKRRLSRLGIQFTHLNLDPGADRAGVLSHIAALNENPTITGVLVASPLPEPIEATKIREAIHPSKDVEGLHPFNVGELVSNLGQIGPCAALAVLRAIEASGVPLEGANAVIVGHSDPVGKPVTLCLLHRLATTTTCHIATRNLAEKTRTADILVVATGVPGLIQADMVKPGAVVIDVGINEVPVGSEDGSAGRDRNEGDVRIVGDVDFEGVSKQASWLTPVPGGIGPLTVAMLAHNTILCTKRHAALAN